MTKTITTRLPDEFVEKLKQISSIENLDTSSVIRRLLAEAIKEWRKDYAVEQYKKGKFSFGQLAEFAGISVWDVHALLKEKQVFVNYDVEEFERELKNIGWKKKKQ